MPGHGIVRWPHPPGLAGAHSQGETLDELRKNLLEVVSLLSEDGEPRLVTEQVFFDKPLLVYGDEKHSAEESRWYKEGQTG